MRYNGYGMPVADSTGHAAGRSAAVRSRGAFPCFPDATGEDAMRVLLLSDIHANLAALEAIDEVGEQYDRVLCLGDVVDYGPDPVECIQWLRRRKALVIRGNHDHNVAQNVPLSRGPKFGFRKLAAETREMTAQLLGDADRRWLARLPVRKWVRVGELVLHLVHATPRDPLDERLFPDPARWRVMTHGLEADLLCVGHTHHQFTIRAGDVTVVNPGSVGQPRDGDPRAAYGLLADGEMVLKRVEYDIDRTARRLAQCPLSERSRRFATAVLREGGTPASISVAEDAAAAEQAADAALDDHATEVMGRPTTPDPAPVGR